MEIKTFYFNPYRECTYIVSKQESDSECIIVDPGMYEPREQKRFAEYIHSHRLSPVAVLITHTHPDHICGLEWLEKEYHGIKKYGQIYTMPASETATNNEAGLSFTVILTPGHKEDCVCFYFAEEGVLFSGDTLFEGSIGRTDLPGGDMNTILHSLDKLCRLADDTKVYPGHGYPTSIGQEKTNNPYL